MQNNDSLPELIKVNKEKCVNCHRCVGVCPVKYCNDASDLEEGIKINPNLCIGCGKCIQVCTHNAREIIDDTKKFFNDLKNGVKISTLVSPAAALSFSDEFNNLLGWFKRIGIQKNFDVSFGAEITTYQYIKAYNNRAKTPIIAQPCPCVVNYIEIYKPNLIKHLAPIGSPTMNMANWVRQNYPIDKLAFISPCIAKKREFEDPNTQGLVSYNITIHNLKKFLKENSISLQNYAGINFDGVMEAERGLLFSQPGGLYETLKRYNIQFKAHQIRRTEGIEIYEEFFDELENEINSGDCNVIIVDVLNCLHGCNRGTGTVYNEYTTDEILNIQSRRLQKHKNLYYKNENDYQKLDNLLKNMDHIDFSRKYSDKSDFYRSLEEPTQEIIDVINREMGKFDKKDIKNCGSCGYNSCNKMIKAIVNNLYRPQQCHHFIELFYKKHSGDSD